MHTQAGLYINTHVSYIYQRADLYQQELIHLLNMRVSPLNKHKVILFTTKVLNMF